MSTEVEGWVSTVRLEGGSPGGRRRGMTRKTEPGAPRPGGWLAFFPGGISHRSPSAACGGSGRAQDVSRRAASRPPGPGSSSLVSRPTVSRIDWPMSWSWNAHASTRQARSASSSGNCWFHLHLSTISVRLEASARRPWAPARRAGRLVLSSSSGPCWPASVTRSRSPNRRQAVTRICQWLCPDPPLQARLSSSSTTRA